MARGTRTATGAVSAQAVTETKTTWPYPWPKGSPPPASPGETVETTGDPYDGEMGCDESLLPGDPYLDPTFTLSPEQITEVQGWLAECPALPDAKALRAAVERSQKANAQTARGERFLAGTYVVGKDIKPGTYVVDQASAGCYWERTDATGEIIDNNFVAGSTRVQVTILASDYSFTNEGCGEFVIQ